MSNSDINPSTSPENTVKINKIINEKIKNAEIKKDLERIQFVLSGPKVGEAISAAPLVKEDGSAFKLTDHKAKPAMVMFYASWNPYINEATIPVLKEITNFYKSKMDFIYVNLDDTKEQFTKTSKAMFMGFTGTNVYGEGGMNSKIAKDLGIYGFKLPSFIMIDKEGKVASKFFFNLGDPELVNTLDKLTGLKAPVAPPEVNLQNDLVTPPIPAPETK
jgi:thiol-disulfide isomerase/thioredoxin